MIKLRLLKSLTGRRRDSGGGGNSLPHVALVEVFELCKVRRIMERRVLHEYNGNWDDFDISKFVAFSEANWQSISSDPRAADAVLRCLVLLGRRRSALNLVRSTRFSGGKGWQQRLKVLMPLDGDKSADNEQVDR